MAAASEPQSERKAFAPKDPPKLNEPKDDPISLKDLANCNGNRSHYFPNDSPRNVLLICLHSCHLGSDPAHPTYVAIMGTVFDVTGNTAYAPGASYNGSCNLRSPTHTLDI